MDTVYFLGFIYDVFSKCQSVKHRIVWKRVIDVYLSLEWI